jgi:hypothetical protein
MKKEKLLAAVAKKETLHPGDGDEPASIGQKMLNEMMKYLQDISSKPIWKKPVEKVKEKN